MTICKKKLRLIKEKLNKMEKYSSIMEKYKQIKIKKGGPRGKVKILSKTTFRSLMSTYMN